MKTLNVVVCLHFYLCLKICLTWRVISLTMTFFLVLFLKQSVVAVERRFLAEIKVLADMNHMLIPSSTPFLIGTFLRPGVIQLHLSGRSVCSNNEAAIEIEQDWSMTASKDNSVDGVELPIATFEPLNTTNVRTSTPPSSPNQAAHSVKASSSNLFHSNMMKWAVQLTLERKPA